jgi:hypothetical protein
MSGVIYFGMGDCRFWNCTYIFSVWRCADTIPKSAISHSKIPKPRDWQGILLQQPMH